MVDEFYIGTKKCGCTVAACVPDLFTPKELAKRLSEWVKDGYAIDRVQGRESLKMLKTCTHKPAQVVSGS